MTVGLNNVSSKIERPVFAAYPLKQLADATDGIFIMACAALHAQSYTWSREQQIGGSGGSLDPPGPLS